MALPGIYHTNPVCEIKHSVDKKTMKVLNFLAWCKGTKSSLTLNVLEERANLRNRKICLLGTSHMAQHEVFQNAVHVYMRLIFIRT